MKRVMLGGVVFVLGLVFIANIGLDSGPRALGEETATSAPSAPPEPPLPSPPPSSEAPPADTPKPEAPKTGPQSDTSKAKAPGGSATKGTEPRRDEWQYLLRHFTLDAFDEGDSTPAPVVSTQGRVRIVRPTVKRKPTTGGFDGMGNFYSGQGLPSGERMSVHSNRFGRIEFLRPPTDGTRSNMLTCEGQEIPVSTKRVFNAVFWLGASHHGEQDGWVEFRFEDGSTGLGPIGLSDWYGNPNYGEEAAFLIHSAGNLREEPGSRGARLWLHYTPVPQAKRIVSIKLPTLPNCRIAAMTLGWRDGVKPILPPVKTKPEAALVAIFGERGFRPFARRADLGPERLREAFQKAGISAVVLDHEQLRDVEILDPKTFPVLINPYGNTHPQAAEESIRAYRKKGGAMVHFGVPFTHPVARTVYGSWRDLGHHGECTLHDGAPGLGTGGFLEGPASTLRAAPELAAWGLGEVQWDRFVPRGRLVAPRGDGVQLLLRSSLAPTDEVVPLLLVQGYDADPYAAIVRHRGCAFEGATDLWLGWTCFGLDALERPAVLIEELVVRGTASILREKELLDEERWTAISKPVPDELRTPESLAPIIREDEAWTGRLPAGGPVARKVLHVQIGGLLDADRVLLASAQGLIHQAGGEVSVWLSDGPEDDRRIEAYRASGLVDEIVPGEPGDLLARVGHRRAVVVDPEMFGSLDLACMVAAVEGVLVAYPAHIEGYGLEVAADLRGLFQTSAENYAFARENLAPQLDDRAMALVLPVPESWRVVDYVIARKLFTFWIASNVEIGVPGYTPEGDLSFAMQYSARTPVHTPVLVFPETSLHSIMLTVLSTFARPTLPLGEASNLSFTSGLRAPTPSPLPLPSAGATAEGSSKEAIPEAVPTPGPQEPGPPQAGGPRLALDKVYVACVHADASHLDIFPGLAVAPRAADDASGSRLPRSGRAIAPGAFELYPAIASKLSGDGVPLGSMALGTIDAMAYGAAFGGARDQVRDGYWRLVDRSMREHGQRFLVFRDSLDGGELAAAARGVGSAELILCGGGAARPVGSSGNSGNSGGSGSSANSGSSGNSDRLVARTVVAGTSGAAGGVFAETIEGKVAIRTVLAVDDLTRENVAAGRLPTTRPGFAWTWILGGPPTERDLSIEFVAPSDLAFLFTDYRDRAAPIQVPLVAAGAEWKYDDTGTDLGTAWRESEFADGAWKQGKAELGYGNASDGRPEATTLESGPDPKNRRPTAYLRRAFEVPDPARFAGLRLEVLRDDGCVVWLNGAEAARSNMPEGEVGYATFASRPIGTNEELLWQGFDLEPKALRMGKNVLAVEVHQSGASSSDLGFDLKLTGLEPRSKGEGTPVETPVGTPESGGKAAGGEKAGVEKAGEGTKIEVESQPSAGGGAKAETELKF